MQALEKRIAALEMVNPPAEEKTFVIRFVAPGHLGAEIDGLRDAAGQHWPRLRGETEQELIDRATREVERNQWGAALLLSTVDCNAPRRYVGSRVRDTNVVKGPNHEHVPTFPR